MECGTNTVSPTATSRTAIGIRTTVRSGSTGTTRTIATRTVVPVWKSLARSFHFGGSFCVMKFIQPLVIFEISTICSLSRKYARASMIPSSCSVRIRCLSTSIFSLKFSSDTFFWYAGLKADSTANDNTSIQAVSIVAWMPSLSRFENLPLVQ